MKNLFAYAVALVFSLSVATTTAIAADNFGIATVSTELPHGDKDKKSCCKGKSASKECTKEEAAKCHSDKKSCCSKKAEASKEETKK